MTNEAAYVFKLSYQDVFSNAATSAQLSIVFDSEARVPNITAPINGQTVRSDFSFKFIVFEDAYPGKIILTATFISGPTNDAAAARVIVFADSVREASSEAHTVEMQPLSILAESSNDVASVVPSVDFLHKGTYQFDLSFTDLATNVAPDQSLTVIFDTQTDPLSVTSPVAGGFSGRPVFCQFFIARIGLI